MNYSTNKVQVIKLCDDPKTGEGDDAFDTSKVSCRDVTSQV